MIFSSYTFLFAFLPAVLLGTALCGRLWGRAASKSWLVAASLFFYAWGNPSYLPLLTGTLLFNYVLLRLLGKCGARRGAARLLFLLALAENLGLLFYFKYLNFFLENAGRLAGKTPVPLDLVLPLGISFYTFQLLSCVTDIYRGQSRLGSFLDFAVFVTFFPQLIVGPIIRYDDMLPQLRGESFCAPSRRDVMLGILIFCVGCAKKILLADPLIAHAQAFYAASGGGFFEAWGGVFSFTFAYYFDFSGYTDMAFALGLFFGVRLPMNFNSPYKARNFADFWRRWNITVSQFFNDYVFRRIFRFGNRLPRLLFATMATFLVSGVWHGAGWNFIVWGLFNGALVCAANVMTLKRRRMPAPLAWALTFFFVLLARVLFDSASLTQAAAVYRSMLDPRPFLAAPDAFLAQGAQWLRANADIAALNLAGAAICFFAPNTGQLADRFSGDTRGAVFAGALLAASLFWMGSVSHFLYFQF